MMFVGVVSLWLFIGPPAKLADLEFTQAVEESILRESSYTLSEKEQKLLEKLDSDNYLAREAASKSTVRHCLLGDHRMLFWGRRSRSSEVRVRCNNILRRLNPCLSCGGTGNSRHYREDPCWDCQGIGSVWCWSAFD